MADTFALDGRCSRSNLSVKKADKQYLDKIASLGCIICTSPAEIHHIRSGMGMGQRSPHSRVLPLCPAHHRTGGYGVAYHAGRGAWENNFGTELKLWEQLKNAIEGQDG